MKLKTWILMMVVAAAPIRIIFGACAEGETSAGTSPKGNIQVSPDQRDGQKQVVAVGKNLTFTAGGLKDADCDCGNEVQDSIDPQQHVKWIINQGSFTGNNIGTPKTWKSPTSLANVITVGVKLQVDDDNANSPHTTDDGGFTEVASINVDVVYPDRDTPQAISGTCTDPKPDGVKRYLLDTVRYTKCAVDFEGLQIRELVGTVGNIINECDSGVPSTGTNWSSIRSGNMATPLSGMLGNDQHSVCARAGDLYLAGCMYQFTTQWVVRTPDLDGISFFKRTYTFINGSMPGVDYVSPTSGTLIETMDP
ncbi:MAG: hypothetical protein PHV34_18470 [Verrucomicrobiae bacterium]|nr:hypothetical protein [Verrucomicrobiae bacterium]